MTLFTPTAMPRLLVLGGHNAGKSTYRAQLCQRIEHGLGCLQLGTSLEDRTAIEKDVERLIQGLQPYHTSVNTYHSTTFIVHDAASRRIALEFADYDGEQVGRMSRSNTMPLPWVERAQNAQSWMYFIRIDPLRREKSFMTDPIGDLPPGETAGLSAVDTAVSNEISAVETLQRLLFVREASLRHPLHSPRLAVLLSCWDELVGDEANQLPAAVLEQRAPLFYRFVTANWRPSELRLWGLSSTERRLPEDEPNREFARKGAEHFGYVVLDDGKPDPDLTLPVAWLIHSA